MRQALAAGLTRAERRGLAASVQSLSMQLPRAIGPLLGGALFHAGYLALPFYLGAALQLGYLLLFVVFFRDTEAARARPSRRRISAQHPIARRLRLAVRPDQPHRAHAPRDRRGHRVNAT